MLLGACATQRKAAKWRTVTPVDAMAKEQSLRIAQTPCNTGVRGSSLNINTAQSRQPTCHRSSVSPCFMSPFCAWMSLSFFGMISKYSLPVIPARWVSMTVVYWCSGALARSGGPRVTLVTSPVCYTHICTIRTYSVLLPRT